MPTSLSYWISSSGCLCDELELDVVDEAEVVDDEAEAELAGAALGALELAQKSLSMSSACLMRSPERTICFFLRSSLGTMRSFWFESFWEDEAAVSELMSSSFCMARSRSSELM